MQSSVFPHVNGYDKERYIMKKFIFPVTILLLIMMETAYSAEYRPVSVYTSAETWPGHEIAKIHDGLLSTTACLLDDSRTGKEPKTIPANGSAPVTGTFVLDLGESRSLCGIRLTAKNTVAAKMAQRVSLFSCDDSQGKTNVHFLLEKQDLPAVIYSQSAFLLLPKPVTVRYLGVRIDESYERPDNFPVMARNRWFQGSYRGLQGGYGYDTSGSGSNFFTEIAEVSVFDKIPSDYSAANKPDQAFPLARLHRDWLYRDFGMDYAKTVDSMNETKMKEYLEKCGQRRLKTLQKFVELAETNRFIYVKHTVIGGGTMHAATENLTDTQYDEWNPDWRPGSQLCMFTIHKDGTITNEILLETKDGFIRDPDLSFDGKTLVFSMRKNHKDDDFHLYTMDLQKRKPVQITFTAKLPDGTPLPCGDTEPCFTPSGNIVFQSTRCEQIIPCWKNMISNLYTCQADGSKMYRIGFDQVNTYYPKVMNDGRIIFTRWEYNDRDSSFTQALMTMNADGTSQLGYYGNSSQYPVSLFHARQIPDSHKVVALAAGHYVLHKGKLIVIDRHLGSEEDSGIEYIAGSSPEGTPGRWRSKINGDKRFASRVSRVFFGQFGAQYQAPYPLSEEDYLLGYLPEGSPTAKGPYYPGFGVYYMTAEGDRELLAFDPTVSSSQAIPVVARPCPPNRESTVDHHRSFGRFFIQNVYLGLGMPNVPKGTVKKLRVVALEYRPCLIGGEGRTNTQKDPPYAKYTDVNPSSAHVMVSMGGTWDVKHVLGEVDVEEDGSCYFEVPANNAVYFQTLDEKGRVVQSMRSWTVLMPGEQMSCIGCHEDKNQVGVAAVNSRALASQKPVQKLKPIPGTAPHPLLARLEKAEKAGTGLLSNPENYLGVNQARDVNNTKMEGFSYINEIQPIWDRHCTSCHTGEASKVDKNKSSKLSLRGDDVPMTGQGWLRNFSRSYVSLVNNGQQTPLVNWYSSCAIPELMPPYAVGSTQSRLMDYLEPSHYNVQLSDSEKRLVACWIDLAVPFCGSYYERNLWTPEMKATFKYHQEKRRVYAEKEIVNGHGDKKTSMSESEAN